MATGLAPITGVRGFVREDAFATAEERHGGTVNPAHTQVGEQATPYPWQKYPGGHGPYGPENQLLGDAEWYEFSASASEVRDDPTMDQSPVRSHAAPWPKGVPTSPYPADMDPWRQQSLDIHSSDLGGSRELQRIPTADPVQDDWKLIDHVDPGVTFPQMVPIPQQIMSGGAGGWGSRDRIQSQAQQNSHGFDSAHMLRRYADGRIPGNFLWMNAGQRPLIKSIPGTAVIPTGPDSPFAGQDYGESYDAQGAALMVLPASYGVPPDPAVAQSYPQDAAEPDTSIGGLL